MPSPILPPHTSAKRLVGTAKEPALAGWPGTYIPNFSQWRPGDIVLVRRERGFVGLAVGAGQTLSFRKAARDGAQWTHAGLYVGNGDVVEAVPGLGVVRSSVWKYCQWRALMVRRIPYPFTPADGVAAANVAVAAIGQAYSMSAVVLSKLIPSGAPDPNALYCSTFVGIALERGSGFSLYGEPRYRPLHPSVLATHPDLVDVDVEWRHF